MPHCNQAEFDNVVGDLLTTSAVLRLKTLRHHYGTRYDHSLRVAHNSYALACKLGLDSRAVARAGLLHDLFFHDATCRPAGYHGAAWKHPQEAVCNAARLTPLTAKEQNIILAHMWPLSRNLPHSPEAWLVNVVDTVVAVGDWLRNRT